MNITNFEFDNSTNETVGSPWPASNGGYVNITNFDNSTNETVGSPKYYTGQTITHKAELVIDLVKPVHCSVGSTCLDNMLDRGPPITKAVSE